MHYGRLFHSSGVLQEFFLDRCSPIPSQTDKTGLDFSHHAYENKDFERFDEVISRITRNSFIEQTVDYEIFPM